MEEKIRNHVLQRLTFYDTKKDGKPVRFIRSMSENEDPRLQALRMYCEGNESFGSYRDCLAMYHILASEVLNTDGNGFLSEFCIKRALALDYEQREIDPCLKNLIKCGLILQVQDSKSELMQYAILDEQCARLKRDVECVKNRLRVGKTRNKDDVSMYAQYSTAQEALTVEDVAKYGKEGVLARLLGTKQGQPVTEAVPDMQTEAVPDIQTEEQEEAEQPETSSQGQCYAGRGRYWDDCVESQGM